MLFFDTGTFMLNNLTAAPNICLDFIFDAGIELTFVWDEC